MNDTTQTDIDRSGLPAGLHDETFVSEYGRIEAIRAARYNTSFSLILADISGIGQEVPASAYAFNFKSIASAILNTVRGCDVVGTTGDGRVAMILPETDLRPVVTIRKLARAVEQSFPGPDLPPVIFS